MSLYFYLDVALWINESPVGFHGEEIGVRGFNLKSYSMWINFVGDSLVERIRDGDVGGRKRIVLEVDHNLILINIYVMHGILKIILLIKN